MTINHQSIRSKPGRLPNAKLSWSISDKKSLYYQQRTLEDLREEHYGTMSMDFIATRNIYPDEEVFIDYGEEWQNAWDEHVNNFVSPCHPSSATKEQGAKAFGRSCLTSKFVMSMNNDKFNPNFHKWSQKHLSVCSSSSIESEKNQIIILTETSSNDLEDELYSADVIVASSFHGIHYNHEGFSLVHRGREWSPCCILGAEKEDKVFDVVVFTTEEGADESLVGSSSVLRRVQTLPAHQIKFIHKPYTSDVFWEGAFRHEIKIPDEIFPPLWKDLRQDR